MRLVIFERPSLGISGRSKSNEPLPPSSVNSRDRAYVLNNLGLALAELGRLADARDSFLKAIELEKGNPVNLDPRLPRTLNDLAGVQRDLGNLDLAKQYDQEALKFGQSFGRMTRSCELVSTATWG
jgi:tetratricopeptide (TPR) repeat protein